MKIDTVDGVYELDVPEESTALFVVALLLEKRKVAGFGNGFGHLYEVDDAKGLRIVGRKLAPDETVDIERRYYYVSSQPVDA